MTPPSFLRSGPLTPVARVFRHAIINQVIDGRPRLKGLPLGIRILATTVLVLVIVGLATRLFVPITHKGSPLFITQFTFVLLSLGALCTHLAAAIIRRRWRICLWIYLGILHLVAIIAGIAPFFVFQMLLPLLIVGVGILVGSVCLLIGTILGGLRGITPAVIALDTVGVAGTMALPLILSVTHDSLFQRNVELVLEFLVSPPALIMALAGGLSFSTLILNSSQWSVLSDRRPTRTRGLAIATIILAPLALASLVWALGPLRFPDIFVSDSVIQSTIFFVVAAVVTIPAVLLSHRFAPRIPPYLSVAAEDLSQVAMPLGLALFTFIPLSICEIIFHLPPIHWIGDFLAAAVAFAFAVRAIRRGSTALVAILSPIGVGCVFAGVRILTTHAPFSSSVLSLLGLIAVLVLTVIASARKRMTVARWRIVIIAIVLCALWPWRTTILEPLETLFSASSQSVILVVGLIWLMFTEAEYVNVDTPHAPRASRVLLFCAHLISAVALTYAMSGSLSANDTAQLSNAVLGFAVVIGALVSLGDLARWNIDPDPRLCPALEETGAVDKAGDALFPELSGQVPDAHVAPR